MATGQTGNITGTIEYSTVYELTDYDDILDISNANLTLSLPAGDIEMMKGNDTVNITDSTVNGATGVAIKLGSGNDALTIENSTIRSSIRLGTGEDYAIIGGSVTDTVTLNALNPDQTSIDTAEDLTTLSLGSGNDVIELKGTLKGNGVINFGDGNDTLKFNGGTLANNGGIANINNLSVTSAGGSSQRDIILYGADNYFELNGNFIGGKTITVGSVGNADQAAFTLKVDDSSDSASSFNLVIDNRTFTQEGNGKWGLSGSIQATNSVLDLNHCSFGGNINSINSINSTNTDWTLKEFFVGKNMNMTGGELSYENGNFRNSSVILNHATLRGKNLYFSDAGLSASRATIELTSGSFRGYPTAFLLLTDSDIKLDSYIFHYRLTKECMSQLRGSAQWNNVTFSNNIFNKQAIYLKDANLKAENVKFIGNSFPQMRNTGTDVAIINATNCSMSFSNVVFSGNYCSYYFYSTARIYNVDYSSVYYTSALAKGFRPIAMLNNGDWIFDNVLFKDNQADCIQGSGNVNYSLVDVEFTNNGGKAIDCDCIYTLTAGKTIVQSGNGVFTTGVFTANVDGVQLTIGSKGKNTDAINGSVVKKGLGTLTVYSEIADNGWTLVEGFTQLLGRSRTITISKWNVKAAATLQLSEYNETLKLNADSRIEGTIDLGGGSDTINTGAYHLSGGKLLIGTLTIQGSGGKVSSVINTRVPNAAFDLTLANVELASVITGGGGDDKITITQKSTISGTMDLGNGKNSITATSVVFANTLGMGKGDDTISVTGNVTFNQTVTLGAGDDTLTIGGNATFDHSLILGEGNNWVKCDGNFTVNENANGGSGTDTLTIKGNAFFKSLLELGDGNNAIKCDGNFTVSGGISSGSGNDTITLLGANTTACMDQIVDLGGGTNKISIQGVLTGNRKFQVSDTGSTSVIIYRGASVKDNTVTVFASSEATLRALTLDWSDIEDMDKVRILVSTDPTFATYEFNLELYNRVKSFTINMEEGYFYQFQANDEDGWAIRYLTDVTAPDQVTGLSTELEESGTVAHWDTTHDDWGGNGVSQYRVQIATDSAFANVVLEQLVSDNRLAMDQIPVGNYHFRVQAIDFTGNVGQWSETCSFTCGIPDTEPPTVPTSLQTTKNGAKVTFAWNASTDGDSGVAGYELKVVRNGRTETVKEVSGTSVTLELAESDYTWSVTARDNFGNASAAANGEAFQVLLSHAAPAEVALAGAGVAEMATGTSGDEAFRLTPDGNWGTYHVARWNGGSDRVSLAGFNRFQDAVSGNGGYDLLQLPDGDNALLYRDLLTPKASGADGAARLAGLAEIAGGSGKDVIDLTDAAGGYTGDILLKGGAGDDRLWAGKGDDILVGGAGDDDLRGGAGDDLYLFGENWGRDTVLDDGGTLVFDNALQGKLTFSATSGGTRITDGTNSVELNWQADAAAVAYADVASLTELRRDTVKGFLA